MAVAPFQKAAAVVSGSVSSPVGEVCQYRQYHGRERDPARGERRAAPADGGLRPGQGRERGLQGAGEHPEPAAGDDLPVGLRHRAGPAGFLLRLHAGPGQPGRRGRQRCRHQRRGLPHRHGGGGRGHQLQGDDHPAPQLQRRRCGVPHPGQRHHHRQLGLRRRRSVRVDQSGPQHPDGKKATRSSPPVWAGCSPRTCWWAWCRSWCRKSAANPPSR